MRRYLPTNILLSGKKVYFLNESSSRSVKNDPKLYSHVHINLMDTPGEILSPVEFH